MPSPVEDLDENEFLDWWMLVKHPDGFDEYVQVHQMENYFPKSKTDFRFGEKYTLKTASWSKIDGKVRRYKVYIARMEETLDQLKKSVEEVRPKWPVLKPSESDFFTTDDEKLEPRESPAALDRLKRNAADDDLEALANRLPVIPENDNCLFPQFLTSTPRSKSACQALNSKKNSSTSTKKKTPKKPTLSDFVQQSSTLKSDTQPTKRISDNSKPGPSGTAIPQKKIKTSAVTQQKLTTTTEKPSQSSSKPSKPTSNTSRSENETLTCSNSLEIGNSLGNDSFEMLIEQPDGTLSSINFNRTIDEKNRYILQLEEQVNHWKRKAQNETEEKEGIAQQLAQMNERLSRLCEMEGEVKQIKAVLNNMQQVPRVSAVAVASGLASTCSSSSNTSSAFTMPSASVLDCNGDMVNLGEGVTCTLTAYTTITTKELSTWCLAILQGVFGVDDAKLYRYRVQTKNKGKYKEFPHKFNNVAKILYQEFLKRKEETFSLKDVPKILSILSKKARDLNGKRNKPASNTSAKNGAENHNGVPTQNGGDIVEDDAETVEGEDSDDE